MLVKLFKKAFDVDLKKEHERIVKWADYVTSSKKVYWFYSICSSIVIIYATIYSISLVIGQDLIFFKSDRDDHIYDGDDVKPVAAYKYPYSQCKDEIKDTEDKGE